MAYSHHDSRLQTASTRSRDIDLSGGDGDWPDEAAAKRDWKKLVLVIGLGALSWVATYIGMLELIEANMGDLPLMHKAIIGFSVAMLMTMIIWLLDQMFAPIPPATKLAYVAGYVFLTLISVGFGFGFYWKVLESRSESSRSAESAVTQVQSALHGASTRMVQLSTTLDQLNQLSTEKAELERVKGASCPNSRPGDGPRRKLRDEDAQRFGFAANFVKTRVDGIKSELGALDGDLAKVVSDDKSTVDAASGTRNDFMRSLGRKLDITVTGFNAFRTDPQLKQLRADLAERSEKTSFADSHGGTFACPDPQLQQALKGVVRAIDQLPNLEKPKIAAVEGSEATIEAFRRLTTTFYGALSFKLPPSADELRDLQKKAVQSVEATPAVSRALSSEAAVGLSKRDYIPLAIAVFVDLCLLLVSMGRPMNRLHGLVPKMRAAERGPIIQILSRFNEIHRDDEIRQNFEVFRHVVFDFHGAYYVAVPLDAPYKPSGPYTKAYSTEDIQDLRLEAHLLANLFTSFEKERIFTRVYSPLLTTRAVKKKLLRQGSKFAHADAFRVYRFRDGAWSEIILGAVMGAARRVEAEKKKRRLEEQLFNKYEPTLAPANDTLQVDPIVSHDQKEPELQLEKTDQVETKLAAVPETVSRSGRGGFLSRRAAMRAAAKATQSPASEPTPSNSATGTVNVADYGPYAARASREIAAERYRAALPTLRGEDGVLDRPRRRRTADRSAETEGESASEHPAGEVVLFAIPGGGPETPTATASVPMVADPAADGAGAVMRANPEPTTAATAATPADARVAGPRIGVILRRESAEFTLPASEARIPDALLRGDLDLLEGVSKSVKTTPALTVAANVAPAIALAGIQTLPDANEALSEADPDFDEDDPEPLYDEPDIEIHVEDITRRFRPPAAE